MQKLLNIYKPKGLTPFQTITLLRKTIPEYANETIGFAGRLDPLAHGVLLLMIGEATTKQKDNYLHLPKEYEFEALFGVTTDTYDALGLLSVIASNDLPAGKQAKQSPRLPRSLSVTRNDIEVFIKSKLGKHLQTYPPYSSKPVHGVPLFQWAREGKLPEIELPKREIEIFDFRLVEIKQLSTKKCKKEIFKQIDSVSGDFRQEIIKQTWGKFFDNNQKQQELITAKFCISCSSGTYIRSLVNELGEKLNIGAITLDILRTKVGEYTISKSLNIFATERSA